MNRLLLLAFPLLALLACKPSAQPTAPATSPPPPKAMAAAPSPAPAAPATGAEANKVHNCSSEEAGAPRNDTVTTLKDEKTGATILAAGAKLAGAPGVSVAELSQMPESWAGKTVRLEGNVSTMCNHRRTWFAMQSEDRQGGVVRVLATPAFLVPEGSIGKRARAEGVVELVDVPLETAQHYAQTHQLPVQTRAAVLRATGAEFL